MMDYSADGELSQLMARYEAAKNETIRSIDILNEHISMRRSGSGSVGLQWNVLVDSERSSKSKLGPMLTRLDGVTRDLADLSQMTDTAKREYENLFRKVLTDTERPTTREQTGNEHSPPVERQSVNVSSLLYYDFVRQPSADPGSFSPRYSPRVATQNTSGNLDLGTAISESTTGGATNATVIHHVEQAGYPVELTALEESPQQERIVRIATPSQPTVHNVHSQNDLEGEISEMESRDNDFDRR